MERKYRAWHKIQGISCLCYAVFMICMYWMVYAELSNTSIIVIAVIAALSLITTATSGLIRAIIGHKMGLKSTKRDWLIVGIALILGITYYLIKYF
jgi:hypothetical protein